MLPIKLWETEAGCTELRQRPLVVEDDSGLCEESAVDSVLPQAPSSSSACVPCDVESRIALALLDSGVLVSPGKASDERPVA